LEVTRVGGCVDNEEDVVVGCVTVVFMVVLLVGLKTEVGIIGREGKLNCGGGSLEIEGSTTVVVVAIEQIAYSCTYSIKTTH
jgi:hypothetical protein